MANYYGAVNVGGGWGPPPLEAGLLTYYDQQARQGVGQLASMVGGAIGGGIAAAQPTHAEMQAYYEGAGPGKPPGRNVGRGLKGALLGAAQEADPEVKRRNQEYQALQRYAEAAHGLPKEQTTPMSLDELRGVVRGYEYQAMQREKDAERAVAEERNTIERERQKSIADYYSRQVGARDDANRLDAAQFEADQKWQEAYGRAYQSTGDPRQAIAVANAAAPGGMPPGVAADLVPSAGRMQEDPRAVSYRSALSAAIKAEQDAQAKMLGVPVTDAAYEKLARGYTAATIARQNAEKRFMDLTGQSPAPAGQAAASNQTSPTRPGKVRMVAPDGRVGYVPEGQVDAAIEQGYRRAN